VTRIFWLASYPKSGNTWFRAFLCNYIADKDQPVSINELDSGTIASSRQLFDRAIGIESSDLTADEIDDLRCEAYRRIAAESSIPIYLKVHDAYCRTRSGAALFPADVSAGVIYFVRNPLDVAVSFAHHAAKSFEDAIDRMGDPDFTFAGGDERLHHQLRQRLGTWSEHVTGWLDQCDIPVHLMRYEDMRRDPFQTFRNALSFLSQPVHDERIRRALDFSSFDRLRQQEQAGGFREKPPRAKEFFRSGKIGEGREVLDDQQIVQLRRDHGPAMSRLGYV